MDEVDADLIEALRLNLQGIEDELEFRSYEEVLTHIDSTMESLGKLRESMNQKIKSQQESSES